MKQDENNVCPVCGGIGQVSFFQGESRFLLTTEECPECAGTGRRLDGDKHQLKETVSNNRMKKKKG